MSSKGGSAGVAGYKYSLSMLMGLCRGPVDELVAITVADLDTWASVDGAPEIANNTIAIAKPDLFGGDTKEGGISGTLKTYFGARTQSLGSSQFHTLIAQPISSLRGSMTAFYDGLICANNPYPKKWAFRVRRARKGWNENNCWYPNEAIIPLKSISTKVKADILAMNPAHILLECLTNPVWGRGLPRSALYLPSFVNAANTLCREEFGLCLKWNRSSQTIGEFVQLVINHIGAALYLDRGIGKMVLTLLRKDYQDSELPLFTYESGLLEVSDDVTTAQDNSHSEIVVQWVDATSNTNRETRVQNLAGTQATQSVASTKVAYLGIPTADLAARVAQRDLAAQGSGIKRFKMVFDRRARQIKPGGVFRVTIPDRNIANMVFRAGKVEEGVPTDFRKITVTALQDVFNLEATSYVATPPVDTWMPPDRTASPATDFAVQEGTYYDGVRTLSAATMAALPTDVGDVVVVARQPNAASIVWQLQTAGTGDPLAPHGVFPWTPTAALSAAVGPYDTTLPLTDGTQLALIGALPQSAWLGNEIVKVTIYNNVLGTMTVERGCVDTLPEAHASGTRIWFPEVGGGSDRAQFVSGDMVQAKIQTKTSSDVLDLTSAPGDTITIMARQGKPYPPGNLQFNGVPFALVNTTSIVGAMTATWAHRDRIMQADRLVSHTEASVGPEAGTAYYIQILHGTSLVLLRETTVYGSTFTYTTDMSTEDGDQPKIIFILRTFRGGLLATYNYRVPITRYAVGFGNSYGNAYGS